MATHSRLAASAAGRWSLCAGSAALSEAISEDDNGNQYARLGTAAHALAEHCLREGQLPHDHIDATQISVPINGPGDAVLSPASPQRQSRPSIEVFVVDRDMADAVSCLTSYVHRRCQELGLIPVSDNPAIEVAHLVAKGAVQLESKTLTLPDRDDVGGTADVVIDGWPDCFEIVDYKHGSGVYVPVDQNAQLRCYAHGELRQAGTTDYSTVRYTICQPRHRHAPEDGISSEDMTPEELIKWGRWLSGQAARVDQAAEILDQGGTMVDLFKADYLSVGDDGSHCTYCSHLHSCPAVTNSVQTLLGSDFSDAPEPGYWIPLSGADAVTQAMPWISLVDAWSKRVKGEALTMAIAGVNIPGYRLAEGRSTRRWIGTRKNALGIEVPVTEEYIAFSLQSIYGLKSTEIYTRNLISGPQAEKLIPKNRRKQLNNELMVKPPGKPTLVPLKAPVAGSDIATDFEDDP